MILTIPSAGQYGVAADALPQELPVNGWSSASNMRFRDGYAERFGGSITVFDTPAVTPYWLAPYQTATTRFWVHAGLAAVYVDDGTTRTDITGTAPTGAIDDRWTGGVLNGVLIMNNEKDVPTYWAGNTANNLATLTGWDANWRAKSLRPFKNYLVAIGITKTATYYPHMVKWSSAADPGAIPASWNEADPTVDAGELDVAETGDLMVDQLPLGDANILYKGSSMYAMRYIGGQSIFSFQRLPGNIGALARGCIANTPKGHVVLCAGDVVLHSGGEPESILTGRMRRWLFANMDSTYYARSFLMTNRRRNEVWICFPENGSAICTKALVWNWVDNTLGIKTLASVTYGADGLVPAGLTDTWATDPDPWDGDTTLWDQNEFNPGDSRILFAGSTITIGDSGGSNNGTGFASNIERTGIALDDTYLVKTITAIYPRIDAPVGSTLSIEIGASMDAEVAPTWSTAVTYTQGTTRKACAFATGRFLSLRISASGSFNWRLKSFDVEYVTRGGY